MTDKVIEYLSAFGLGDRVIEFAASTATVGDAAKALGCEEKQICKSMSFLVNNEPILVLLAGDRKIDNSKYKHYFGEKAKMIAKEDLLNLVGHSAGGVCPFAIKSDVKVYLDESLKRFEEVYPAAGSSNSCVKLTLKELEDTSRYEDYIDVSKSID